MRKLALILALLLYAQIVLAAVTLDSTTFNPSGNADPGNWNFTVNGDFLVVCIAGNASAVSYNSVAMTKSREDGDGSGQNTQVWTLSSPSTGSHRIAYTGSGYAWAASFTGTNGVGNVNGQYTGFNITNPGINLSISSGSWVMDCLWSNGFGALTPSANQTEITTYAAPYMQSSYNSTNGTMTWTGQTVTQSVIEIKAFSAPAGAIRHRVIISQ